jgi:predicted PurR-regulated permease PerM
MAVVVNNSPGQSGEETRGSGVMGIFLVLIILAAVVYFLVVYALPGMNQATPQQVPNNQQQPNEQPNQQLNQQFNEQKDKPSGQEQPQINIPDEIDVNIKPTQ